MSEDAARDRPDRGPEEGPEAAGAVPPGDAPLRLSGKFARIQALQAARTPLRGAEGLGLREVAFGEVGALGHRTGLTAPLPYAFERDTEMRSAWIAAGTPARTYGFIGAHSYMNNGGYLRDHVLIGRYCSIGRRVTIGAGMHGMEGLSTSPALAKGAGGSAGMSLRPARPPFTILESDVWIGDGAVVLPGVRLGAGCVIGANAVVTRDALAYGVHAGAPARLLRRRFDDATCEALLAAEWWDRPHDWLRALPLHDVARVLEALEAAPPAAPYETFAVAAAQG